MTASTTTDRQPRRIPHPLTDEQIAAYHRDGYHIARGLWSADEVAACREAFDALAKRGEPIPFPHDPDHRAWDPEPGSDDPLRRYPRVMHPHFFMDLAMRMMLDRRIEAVLTALIEEQPLATQSMYYFKPPGGKGQALHQDNYYLKVRPKTCIAAWTAIDRSYPENGGLYICPGTHTLEIQCPELPTRMRASPPTLSGPRKASNRSPPSSNPATCCSSTAASSTGPAPTLPVTGVAVSSATTCPPPRRTSPTATRCTTSPATASPGSARPAAGRAANVSATTA